MASMPRPRPPHLQRHVSRHGKLVWYVRVGRGPKIRIRAEYGTDAFQDEYEAAIAGKPKPRKAGHAAGSLSWLIEQYRESTAWHGLSRATQRQRENIFLHVRKSAGAEPFTRIDRAHIVAGRDRRVATPAQARNFLDAMRGLFRWALEAKFADKDPTLGVTNPPRSKGVGFPAWTEDDVEKYESRWPLGTKERVWLDILLYTGLRRGDAVCLGRQHVRDGVCRLRTEKTGETVILPILPVLAATLEAGPCGDLTFIAGERGNPLTKESFGNEFREAARAAGVNKSAHGVRKIAATRAANSGATVAELEAIFGWSGGGMASLYTRAADRERLSRRAMHRLDPNGNATSMLPPNKKVVAPERKAKRKQGDF